MIIDGKAAFGGTITTPLFAACVMNCVDMIPILMEMIPIVEGAGTGRINEPSGQGFTPLHGAAQHGCFDAVMKLLDLGVDIDLCSSCLGRRPMLSLLPRDNHEQDVCQL